MPLIAASSMERLLSLFGANHRLLIHFRNDSIAVSFLIAKGRTALGLIRCAARPWFTIFVPQNGQVRLVMLGASVSTARQPLHWTVSVLSAGASLWSWVSAVLKSSSWACSSVSAISFSAEQYGHLR